MIKGYKIGSQIKGKEEYHVTKIRADAFKSRETGIFADYVCNACHSYLSCDNAISVQPTIDLDG
jgi:transcription initiation factor IIE alpha subunit